jgi:hypothetical protein
MTELPHRQAALYDLLKAGDDVAISDLRDSLGFAARDPRMDQQYLSPLITRLNRRLKNQNQRVVPGRLKRTYRLVTISV